MFSLPYPCALMASLEADSCQLSNVHKQLHAANSIQLILFYYMKNSSIHLAMG